ncbi:Opy2p [Nakaseomyces bracarensis]|uniref:Opy2p n=1 Tax=Nakaseomyces bracarensis TaxID=273131 RepID=UPI003871AADF
MSSVVPSQTYSRGTDGCVVCPTAPACPECAEDENCVLTALTCNSCPYTYCSKKTSSSISILSSVDSNGNAVNSTNSTTTAKSSGSHVHVGGLVSGVVVGAVVAFTVLLVLYYWRRHKRVSAMQGEYNFNMGKGDAENGDGVVKWDSNIDSDNDDDDDDDDEDDDLDDDEDLGDNLDREGRGSLAQQKQYERRPPLEDILEEGDGEDESNFEVSYDTSTNKRPNRIIEQFRLKPMRPLKAASDTQSIYSNNTIHTKASSNILPIAYIPGVTITQGRASRGRSNMNHDDIMSHITLGSSILGSEDNYDLETLPIQVMGSNNNNGSNPQLVNNPGLSISNEALTVKKDKDMHNDLSLTTAIRAKPKLVAIRTDSSLDVTAQEGSIRDVRSSMDRASTRDVRLSMDNTSTRDFKGASTTSLSQDDLSDVGSFTVDLDISMEDANPFNDRYEVSEEE